MMNAAEVQTLSLDIPCNICIIATSVQSPLYVDSRETTQ